ncbi:hypothetical protein N182_37505 [Sinorhizobium sp. GL2]|nr:hypothetical protein N182_37505 [Sinorhizobium sp. GL2]
MLQSPFAPGSGVSTKLLRSERIAHRIVRRVDGDKLSKDMRGQFADLQAVLGKRAFDLVAVSLALCRLADVDQALVPGRYLKGYKAHSARPFRN